MEQSTTDVAAERRKGGAGSSRLVLGLIALAAVAMVVVPLAVSRMVPQPDPTRHVFEIPPGTAERLAAGEVVEVIPADLDFALDDRLVIVNNDEREHQIGAFAVAPGETLERRLTDVQSFGGYCSLHASGRIDIDVGLRGP